MTRFLLAHQVEGRDMWTSHGLALLTGHPADELEARFDPAVGLDSLPPDWMRDGQRRSREAQAHTDSINPLWAFQYWAGKLGNTVDVDDELQVWMITPDETSEETSDD
jgi:hypothetical protein